MKILKKSLANYQKYSYGIRCFGKLLTFNVEEKI